MREDFGLSTRSRKGQKGLSPLLYIVLFSGLIIVVDCLRENEREKDRYELG